MKKIISLCFTRPVLFSLLLSCLILSGCGKKSPLEEYESSMNQFYENVSTTSVSINAIVADSEGAVTELLSLLDHMNNSFSAMAALEVPAEFSSVESLADDAAMYMSEAVTLYHQAFSGGTYNEAVGLQAKSQYDNAMLYVKYIGDLLMGNVPEGEGVTITYE